jgi:hypothetical protein
MPDFSNFNIPQVGISMPTLGEIKLPKNPNLADEFHSRLKEIILEFDASLDDSFEVGMKLVSFGQAVVIHVKEIGYYNPSLIRFFGALEDGSPVELVQHVSQISFLLMAVKRLEPDKPKKRIGFINNEE